MATVVKHTDSRNKYILLGSGFGAYQSNKPNLLFGEYMFDIDEGQYAMVCVCDSEGKVGWIESSNVVVETVDGQAVQSLC